MSTRSLVLFLLFFGGLTLQAQIPDSLLPAPAREKAPPIDAKPAPKILDTAPKLEIPTGPKVRTYEPRQALIWALVPGGGQVYNRRWWKVPLVFSAFSGVVAVLDFNQGNYQRFRDAYRLELAGENHEFTELGYSADALRSLRNQFNKNRQTNYFMLLAVYLLQGVEAYVDTHLRNFDMDEDLSRWQVSPQVVPSPTGQGPGTLVVQFQYSF